MNNHDQEIQALIARNKRVEAGKAWEVSWFRRIFIAIFTYVTACIIITMTTGDLTSSYVPALVPSIAYLLSTMTIGPMKNWWIANRLKP